MTKTGKKEALNELKNKIILAGVEGGVLAVAYLIIKRWKTTD